MKIKNKIIFISFILLVLLSITCVSATQELDDNAAAASEIDFDEVSSSSDNNIQSIESDLGDGEGISISKDSQVNNASIKATKESSDGDAVSSKSAVKDSAVLYIASRTVPVREFSNGYEYLVILKDADKKALAGKTVTLKFDGKTYSKTTDNKGWANFILKGNSKGNYDVEASFAGDNSYKSASGKATISFVKESAVLYIASRTVPMREISNGYGYLVILKDADKKALAGKKVSLRFNGNTVSRTTDNKGWANFTLKAGSQGTYDVSASFAGDRFYNYVSGKATVNLVKESSVLYIANKIISVKDVSKGYEYLIILKDANKKALAGKKIILKFNGNTVSRTTDNRGWANFTLKSPAGNYNAEASFAGDKFYNSASGKATIKVFIPKNSSILIGNTHLLTNGFLRIYLKSDDFPSVAKKTLTITIGNKKFTKVTNSEGIVSLSPRLAKNTYVVKVTFNGTYEVLGSSASKKVQCIDGDIINPLFDDIPTINGMPDVDYMPGTFVLADGNMKYTVVKSEYLNVIQRDSYCLYLHNKLTKYTLFKSKAEPNFYHLIHRNKWNVIEREINTQVVLKNQYNWWPSEVTVSLKGKSYTYPEVRDVQNTGYTCGPTSASMCTQVLRNYVNEAYLAQKAGTTSSAGSSTSGLKRALEGFNMKCEVYYKSSFDHALNELKKGGCALIFHTWNHYVCILDISADGKKVLVGNPSGDYDKGSHSIPTNWLTVDYMKGMFNNYDTSGLIVKLGYSLNQKTTNDINQFYKNMGGWNRKNTDERLPQIS